MLTSSLNYGNVIANVHIICKTSKNEADYFDTTNLHDTFFPLTNAVAMYMPGSHPEIPIVFDVPDTDDS